MQTEKIQQVEEITQTLKKMRKNETIKAPNNQRVSFNGTIQRLKDSTDRKYTLKRISDEYFTIKRIR